MIIVAAFIDSCISSSDNDKLALEQRPYGVNKLRLDGYYYLRTDGPMTVYFLYSNGLLLRGGDFQPSNLSTNEEWYRNGTYFQFVKNSYTDWGVFNIDSNTIKFETWTPSDAAWWVFRREGEIINDTTFHISKRMRVDGTMQSSKDETYHFHAFSPKPDSTNPPFP